MSWPGSIRLRVTLLATVTSAVIIALFGWLLIRLITNELLYLAEEELAELTDDVDGLVLQDIGVGGAQYRLEDEDLVLELSIDDLGDVEVDLIPADDPEADPLGRFVLDAGTSAPREYDVYPSGLSASELRRIALLSAALLRDEADTLAANREELLASTEDVLDTVTAGVGAARNAALVIGPLLVLATALTTWFVVGRALAPTRRIAAEASAITPDTLDRRISRASGGDEVDTIARVINEMLDRIEGGVRREQQFVADASHELKTPLASARMAAELAGADAPDSAYPPQLVAEIDRMTALVDDLLNLARSPEGVGHEVVDVGALVDEVVSAHPAGAQVTASFRRPSGSEMASALGRTVELRRVVVNLVDNATRYGDRAEIGLSVDQGSVVLTVDDDGPGIPADDRDRIFERFARLDEGRARNHGGTGLGLAIVAAIVDRHGGTVSAGQAPPPHNGARFEVRLPAAPSVTEPNATT